MRLSNLQMHTIFTLLVIACLLPVSRANAQQEIYSLDESSRRIILVPGVNFKEPINNFQGPYNACQRAIETFREIHELLIMPQEERTSTWLAAVPNLPVFLPQQIYAFDYNPNFDEDRSKANEPCGRYITYENGIQSGVVDYGVENPGGANDNVYRGEDTRTALIDLLNEDERNRNLFEQMWQGMRERLIPSAYAPTGERLGTPARFGRQFRAWREECPECHFDIIAHSLGGVVVASWITDYSTPNDRKHIRSLSTIDSPVNGAAEWSLDPRRGFSAVVEEFTDASGQVAIDLRDKDFVARMRNAPYMIDMRCISNIHDVLIPTAMSIVRYSNPLPTQYDFLSFYGSFTGNDRSIFSGPCDNYVGRYGSANPFDILGALDITRLGEFKSTLIQAAADAHSEPLKHADVKFLIIKRIAESPPLWARLNKILDARLGQPVRSLLIAPNVQTSLDVVIRNTGANTWESGSVELKLVGGSNFGLASMQPIPITVKPGETVTLTLSLVAPDQVGTYPSRWQLRHGTTYFGQEVIFSLIVLPAEQLDPQTIIDDPLAVLRAMFDQLISDARKRLEEEFLRLLTELLREIFRQICPFIPLTAFGVSGFAVWKGRTRQFQREAK